MARKKTMSWWWAVIVVVILGAGVAFGLSGSSRNGEEEHQETKDQTELAEGQAQTEELSEKFSMQEKTKDPTGENCTLQNIRFGSHQGYERVVFDLGGNQVPGYKVEEKGSQIEVFLYDTRDRDLYFRPTYTGPKTVSGEGGVVSEIELFYPPDDSMIGFRISLTKASPFRVLEFENPARIAIDVQS